MNEQVKGKLTWAGVIRLIIKTKSAVIVEQEGAWGRITIDIVILISFKNEQVMEKFA